MPYPLRGAVGSRLLPPAVCSPHEGLIADGHRPTLCVVDELQEMRREPSVFDLRLIEAYPWLTSAPDPSGAAIAPGRSSCPISRSSSRSGRGGSVRQHGACL